MDRDHSNWSKLLWLPALLFGALLNAPAAGGGDGPVSNAASAEAQTASLDYQDVSFPLIRRSISVATQSAPFKKEPVLGNGKVLRGTLGFGGDGSNSMAFVLDRAASKLYLDLNRNLDLADDVAGAFVSRVRGAGTSGFNEFTNVHLPFKTASGERQFLVDLTLWDGGRFRYCTVSLRSFWQGKMVLDGAEWQVGIVESPLDGRADFPGNRFLLLRPWAARDASFSVSPVSAETLALPQKLFVRNHAYRLDAAKSPENDGSKLRLQFLEEQPLLGELKITGQFIQRLMIEGGPFSVVLDQPEAVTRIPVGIYDHIGVWLKAGDREAYRSPASHRMTIDKSKPAVLAAGGPLTNSLSATRHGKSLYLRYQLAGAGGEAYELVEQDRRHPPEFAVYKAGQKIASGKFEFG